MAPRRLGHECKGCRVDAVALSLRPGPSSKHAPGVHRRSAEDLGTAHEEADVRPQLDRSSDSRLGEARPARARVEARLGAEQRRAARGAAVVAGLLLLTYSPVNRASVPARRSTSGLLGRRAAHATPGLTTEPSAGQLTCPCSGAPFVVFRISPPPAPARYTPRPCYPDPYDHVNLPRIREERLAARGRQDRRTEANRAGRAFGVDAGHGTTRGGPSPAPASECCSRRPTRGR